MKNILALSFFPAFLPPRSGGEVRLFGLYNALSEHYQVTLLTSGYIGNDVEIFYHNSNFKEIRVPKGPEFQNKWAELKIHAGSGDLSAPCIAALSDRYSDIHKFYLELYDSVDIIIHDSPFLVGYDLFIGFDKKIRIYNSYNVEFDLYGQLHNGADSNFIAEYVQKIEGFLCKNSQLITVCSWEDGIRFRDLYGYTGHIELIANGIDNFEVPIPSEGRKDLVFIGSAHLPNVTAARLIVDQLAPAFPGYRFHIMGRCLDQGTYSPNVIVHGPVDEAEKRQLFRSAFACVNPMVQGGGSSLKIADVAAHGVPIISTLMGIRGFEFVENTHYIALDTDDLIGSLGRALTADLAGLAVNAAEHIREQFTWDAIAVRMVAALHKAQASFAKRRCFVVLNDYDPFETIGGGATRIRGLYEAVSEEAYVIMLCFSEDKALSRQEFFNGRLLLIAVPKTPDHARAEEYTRSLHHISVADLLAIREAPTNPVMTSVFGRLQRFCDMVICEHPYLVGLPQRAGAKFVYSSHNYELGLKRQMLLGHPLEGLLLSDLAHAESFAVGCAELVVAVSEEDAKQFGAAFPLTGPIVVVPNGAAEPVPMAANLLPLSGQNAVFLGSAHMPNIEAAQFVANVLAPSNPSVTFHIVGTACMALEAVGQNVVLWGVVDDEMKANILGRCDIGLNPMSSGSGSNVKVADYLKNGLYVLSTTFGARGYRDYVGDDITVCDLDDFSDEMQYFFEKTVDHVSDREKRREFFFGKLSMLFWGKKYTSLLLDKLVKRKRVLFSTYRYNYPSIGGGEIYANRMIEFLADAGFEVDVIAPAVIDIVDTDRFASEYPLQSGIGEIPVGNPRIRCAKFPVGTPPRRREALSAIWRAQPLFEKMLFACLEDDRRITGLLWGWCAPDPQGRWACDLFGLTLMSGGAVHLSGYSPGKRFVRISVQDGALLGSFLVEGDFEISLETQPGILDCRVFEVDELRPDDVRPLSLYLRSIKLAGAEFVHGPVLSASREDIHPMTLYSAMRQAALKSRSFPQARLDEVRGPYSKELEDYVEKNIGKYDLLISHNAVFRTATKSISCAKKSGVPSILIPHLHFEDDYYHFPDIYEACRKSDLVLVTPKAAVEFLSEVEHCQVQHHIPGVDTSEVASARDIERFRCLYPETNPFFLVVGRKTTVKGYRKVIEAVANLRVTEKVGLVIIGPDEDRLPIEEKFVSFLGRVDRDVLRGALACCLGVVNMSSSESFGIALVEAGLAGVPVIANRFCASFNDIIDDGVNGYLVDSEELSERLRVLATDAELRRRMGLEGRARAMGYEWSGIGSAFVSRCEELLERAAAN